MNSKLKTLAGFPGSVLLIPMFLSAVINTFLPELVLIGEPVTSLLNGSGVMTLLFIMLFVSGMMLDVRRFKAMMKKSLFLLGGRLIVVIIAYSLYTRFFGEGGLLQVSALALLIALCSTNPGIFVALIKDYGEEEDLSLFGPLNLLPLPVIPLSILSVSQGGAIEMGQFIALLLPFLLGILVGNLNQDLKVRLGAMTPVILFFWGLGIGSKINLTLMTKDILSGSLLVVLYYLLMMVPLFFVERKAFKNRGLLTLSSSSVAAIALVVPQMATEISDTYTIYVSQTMNQLAFAVAVTSIVTPLLVKKFVK